jgi:hypothetical protein
MAGRNRITIQTSVRAFYSIGLGIDRAISISWKKGGPICNKAMTVDLSKLLSYTNGTRTPEPAAKQSLQLRCTLGAI